MWACHPGEVVGKCLALGKVHRKHSGSWHSEITCASSRGALSMKRPVVLCVVVGSVVAACGKSNSKPETERATAEAPLPVIEASPPETQVSHIDQLGYDEAFAYAKAQMKDIGPAETDPDSGKRRSWSDGTVLFALWAAKAMAWTDIAVTKDETTYALARKNSGETRGKRLCTSGAIIQITEQDWRGSRFGGTEDRKVATGFTSPQPDGDLFEFVAVGSSGALVQNSPSRFCGVVTGTRDYANSLGGTSHAVTLVGMFDLPRNRPKKN
jgi:hypothetical protein